MHTNRTAGTSRLASMLLGASALAIGLGGLSAPAFAQAAPAPAEAPVATTQEVAEGTTSTSGLEDIVVTARKVSENLQTVPISITAFSGDQLIEQNAFSIRDVANFTPGFTARQSPSNPTGFILNIRGQVQTDILATLDPSVGTYVDGVNWARAYGLNADLLDVQTLQVLKGPQGTLFGRNTTGGALVIQTNDPSMRGASVDASFTYGNYNTQLATGVVNLPIIPDFLAIRGAILYAHRDGIVTDNVTGTKYDERDTLQGRVKALFEVDDFHMILSGEWYDFSSNGPSRIAQVYRTGPNTPPYAFTARIYTQLFPIPGQTIDSYIASTNANFDSVALNQPISTDVTTQTYDATLWYDTSFGQIKFITGTRQVSSNSSLDLDGSQYKVHTTTGVQDLSQYSAELQVTGKAIHDTVDFALGALYFTESGFDTSTSIVVPNLNPATSSFFGQIDNVSKGLYGQVTWRFWEGLSFTGGLRYSDDSKGLFSNNGSTNRNTGKFTCSYALGCPQSRKDDFSNWSYTAGLDYQINDGMMAYIKYSSGYRAGGQNLRATSAVTFVPFQPELVHEGEIGFKGEFMDRRLRTNLAVFKNNTDNAQRSTLVGTINPPSTSTILGNAAKVSTWGLEADATFLIIEGLTATGTVALVYPKYDEYSELPSPQNPTGDRTNERFDGVTNETATFAMNYGHDFGVTNMNLWAGLSYMSSSALQAYNQPLDPNNAAIIAASTRAAAITLDARASFGFSNDQYNIAIWGRNITDNRAWVQSLLVDPIGYQSGVRRDPATFGVTGTVKFGY